TDLERLAAATGSAIETLDEPGGGEAVRLRDPDGRMVDVVFGIEAVPAIPVRTHPPLNSGERRERVGTLQRVGQGPSSRSAASCAATAAAIPPTTTRCSCSRLPRQSSATAHGKSPISTT